MTEELPIQFCVKVELYEFDGAIGRELANDGKSGHECPGHDEEAVVISLGNQPWQVIEVDCEAIDDSDELKHLEIVRRRLAIRAPLGVELPVEVFEEHRRRANDASR